MKRLLAIILVVVVPLVALAAGPTLPRDGDGLKLQGPAWDATRSQLITSTASQNITVAGRIWYEFTPATDCKGRLMNTTIKSNWPQFSLYAKTPFCGSNNAVAAKATTVYLNLSGCTGDYRAQ